MLNCGIAALFLFAAATAAGWDGAVTTMGWTGNGETNAWRHASLGTPFSDGAARFAAESRIVSPVWNDVDVLRVDVRLRCSTNAPSRFLQVDFLRNGRIVSGPTRFAAVVRADRAETQSVKTRREHHANGIALSLSAGDVGDWGVYDVRLMTAATTRMAKGFAVTIR